MMLYVRLAWFNFNVFFAYPLELLATLIRPLCELGIVLLFWSIVSHSSDNAINFTQLVSYFLIATGISDLIMIDGLKFGSKLGKSIKRGELSQTLIKPVNPLLYQYFQLAGTRGLQIGLAAVFIITGLCIQPPASMIAVGLFCLQLSLAIIITFSISVIVASLSFYITEINGVRNMLNHLIRILSGALIPLYLFPDTIKSIANLLPFASTVYGPTVALQATSFDNQAANQLAVALIWAVILVPVSLWFWKHSLKRYDAIGI